MGKITESYGKYVFGQKEMQKRLSPSTYSKFINTVKHGEALDENIAEDVARAMKEWAQEHGATHFTHWFQPQRSGTAEKHDAFINYDGEGGIIEEFSPSQLIQSEPDASSFPSGGIRSTFEARGYTAWDPTSPAFIRKSSNGSSLVIPSIYLSWTGEALDMKTPLMRSLKSLDTYAIKLQRLLGNRAAKRSIVYSGMEQEYFLIPKDIASKRPDLLICNRTIFGAAPIKGQSMEDHYFGAIRPKVMEFMNALDQELYTYGIPVKTKHNEVAPNQFELAPIYEEVKLAIDHNLQIMDIMERIGNEFGFFVILHEKPFAGLNGSGKHMNWSIGDNTGANYLEPSKSPLKNVSFLMTLGALLLGVQKFSGLLRASIADAGNEHRLGSHEAPPAILSIYLGDYLTEILDHIEGIKQISEKELNFINLGLQNMPKVVKDISDRNRTSPIAFTGNKFEFRAVGSAANGCNSATAMNMVCAYGYKTIIDRLEKFKNQENVKENCVLLLKEILQETKAVRFEGNNYSEDWVKEAKKRKLYIADTTPQAIMYPLQKESVELHQELQVLSERELESRIDIRLEAYSKTKSIEIKVALDMVRTSILPSITKQLIFIGNAYKACSDAGIKSTSIASDMKDLETLYTEIKTSAESLSALIKTIEAKKDTFKVAEAFATEGTAALNALREHVDAAELLVSDELWTLPRYDQLLTAI